MIRYNGGKPIPSTHIQKKICKTERWLTNYPVITCCHKLQSPIMQFWIENSPVICRSTIFITPEMTPENGQIWLPNPARICWFLTPDFEVSGYEFLNFFQKNFQKLFSTLSRPPRDSDFCWSYSFIVHYDPTRSQQNRFLGPICHLILHPPLTLLANTTSNWLINEISFFWNRGQSSGSGSNDGTGPPGAPGAPSGL